MPVLPLVPREVRRPQSAINASCITRWPIVGFIVREDACHSKVPPPWRLDPVALKGFARAVTVFVVNQ
jgi:hypothetical protein